jgi:hypothetical protein
MYEMFVGTRTIFDSMTEDSLARHTVVGISLPLPLPPSTPSIFSSSLTLLYSIQRSLNPAGIPLGASPYSPGKPDSRGAGMYGPHPLGYGPYGPAPGPGQQQTGRAVYIPAAWYTSTQTATITARTV